MAHAFEFITLYRNNLYLMWNFVSVNGKPFICGAQRPYLEMGDGIEHTLCAFSHEESVFTACSGSVEVGIQLAVVVGERHNILREKAKEAGIGHLLCK